MFHLAFNSKVFLINPSSLIAFATQTRILQAKQLALHLKATD